MGREARVKKDRPAPTRVPIPKAEYCEWRMQMQQVALMQQEAEKQIQAAHAKALATFMALGKAHGFDPDKTWSWDDEHCELIEVATT